MKHSGYGDLLLCLLLATWLIVTPARADSCSRPIQVAATAAGSSLFITSDKQIKGAYADLLSLVTKQTGCHFIFTPMPIKRALIMLKHGKIDLLPIAAYTKEREKYGEFIATSQSRLMVIFMRDRPVHATTLAQLRDADNLLLNVVRGYSFSPAYDAWIQDPRTRTHLEEITNADMIAGKLKAGRIAAAVMPLAAVAESIKHFNLEGKIEANPLLDIPPIIFGTYLAKTNLPPEDRQLLHTALHKLVQDQVYLQLQRHYYPDWASKLFTLPPNVEPNIKKAP